MCWGSFLNVIAYRLINGISIITPRSFCPHCKHQLIWYDNVPIVSWLLLQGRCRYCRASISYLYPFIESITTLILAILYFSVDAHFFPAYFIFFSALIVSIRSDLEHMLLSRFVTLFLVPIGFLFSFYELLPINLTQSLIGSLVGSGFLYITALTFKKITGRDGLGQGDSELLAFIGSFLGPFGCWIALCLGSLLGAVSGITYMAFSKKAPLSGIKIPFGPFLAAGAILTVLFQETITNFLLFL